MATASVRLLVAVTLALPALSLSACTQGPGDHCQIDSDCSSDYFCALPNANPRTGGTCQPRNTDMATAATPDMAVAADMATAPADMAAPVDMVPVVDLTGLADMASAVDMASTD